MIKIIIWIVLSVVLFSLFMVNEVKIREKDKIYEAVLCYINSKKMLLPNDGELRTKDECYKVGSFFKMHNKGTELNEDIGEIEFEPLDNNVSSYFL